MENQNEGNLLRRAHLMEKYGDLIAKSAKWMEQEREREPERIAKAARDAAAAEHNLLHSYESERRRKECSAIRQQRIFKKTGRRASRCAMKAMKKAVEIADVTSDSPSPLLTAETLKLVEETADEVNEFLKSTILCSPLVDQ